MTIASFLLIGMLVSAVTSTAADVYYKNVIGGGQFPAIGLLAAATLMSFMGYGGVL